MTPITSRASCDAKNYIHDKIFPLATKVTPFQVLKKAEGKENRATVDASKAKEENLEVAGQKCSRGKWLGVLNVTGEIFNCLPMKVILVTMQYESKVKKYISETLILPFVVLFAMVAYAVLAIVFYNNDG